MDAENISPKPETDADTLSQLEYQKVKIRSRKRNSEAFETDADSSDSTDNIRQKPDIVTYARTPGVYRYHRRVNPNEPKIDFFTHYNVPTSILDKILSHLNKQDLSNAMATCCRFYTAGACCSNWQTIDLYNKTIREDALISIFTRRTKIARVAEAKIIRGSIDRFMGMELHLQLTHLDLGRASFSRISTLTHILKGCQRLLCLSLEGQDLGNGYEVCEAVAQNRMLECLDLSLVRGICSRGAKEIAIGCVRLRELNMAWCELDYEAVELICHFLPSTVTHINLSGTKDKKSISDGDVIALCKSCPNLMECDLSDNVSLGDVSLDILNSLDDLSTLSLSRCYGINPMNFLNCDHLYCLNVFQCMTEDGEKALRLGLPHTNINHSHLSYIAKPTVPPHVSSIWQQRTKDMY